MPITAPVPNPVRITQHPPPVYAPAKIRRKPLTDIAALTLLDEVTVYAALFSKHAA